MRTKINYKVVYVAWKNDGAKFQCKTNLNEKNGYKRNKKYLHMNKEHLQINKKFI
jgi:hypothetical protein